MSQSRRSPYKRALLKITGEALSASGSSGRPFDSEALARLSREIILGKELGVDIAIVVGGGNILRGSVVSSAGADRVSADYMGMLATIINGMALQETLERLGCSTRLMTSIDIHQLAEPYVRRRALRHLEKGRVTIFAGGTGNPYFTTDTAASLRAMEIGADLILKATKVDGVYDADPMTHPGARRYDRLRFIDALKDDLKIMDAAAISLCMENDIPILVFNMTIAGNIRKALAGESVGTVISSGADASLS